MSLRSGKLPSLGSEDEFFDHKGCVLDCGEAHYAPPAPSVEVSGA